VRYPPQRMLPAGIPGAARTPELGDIFYQRGPGLTAERPAAYLRQASKRGVLHCPDPLTAARLFVGAVVSHYRLRHLVQSRWKPPTEREIRQHVQAAVTMFLAQHRSC
jgi:TetR/AcrR family transcriptional regulator, mexJK operon transcriptional repressor